MRLPRGTLCGFHFCFHESFFRLSTGCSLPPDGFQASHTGIPNNASGLIRSNTRRNVSLSGIPFGNVRNCLNHSSLSFPNSSISWKSSPLQIMVHSPITIISSSLCRIFPRSVLRGSSSLFSRSAIFLSPYLYSTIFHRNFKCCCPDTRLFPLRSKSRVPKGDIPLWNPPAIFGSCVATDCKSAVRPHAPKMGTALRFCTRRPVELLFVRDVLCDVLQSAIQHRT